MSTADSYLNSTAVAFTKDIYVPLLRPAASDRRRLVVQRLVTLVVGVAVVIFALSAPSIIDALLLTYNLWAPTVVVPLVADVVFGLRSRNAGVVSIVAGGTAMSIWLWGLNEPFGITALIVGVAVNIVAYALAYAFDSRHDRLDLAADVDLRVDPEPAPPRPGRQLTMYALLLYAVPRDRHRGGLVIAVVGTRFYLQEMREAGDR